MKKNQLDIIRENVEKEPYVSYLGIKVLELKPGQSVVRMKAEDKFNNIFSITHGGAIFSLIDVAFGSAANSYGTIAVALSMSINYVMPARAGDVLTAAATQVSQTAKTAAYNIVAKNASGQVIATCQAVAYLKKQKLPFLDKIEDNS
ncbi:MAG: PaaI family thioesterase [Actinomycetota bacterium]